MLTRDDRPHCWYKKKETDDPNTERLARVTPTERVREAMMKAGDGPLSLASLRSRKEEEAGVSLNPPELDELYTPAPPLTTEEEWSRLVVERLDSVELEAAYGEESADAIEDLAEFAQELWDVDEARCLDVRDHDGEGDDPTKYFTDDDPTGELSAGSRGDD